MSDVEKPGDRLEQVRAILRDQQSEPQFYDPDLARTYAGQWVVVHQGRVIAHGKKGSDLIEAGYVRKHPGSRVLYVPTLEQQEGAWILPLAGSDA